VRFANQRVTVSCA